MRHLLIYVAFGQGSLNKLGKNLNLAIVYLAHYFYYYCVYLRVVNKVTVKRPSYQNRIRLHIPDQ